MIVTKFNFKIMKKHLILKLISIFMFSSCFTQELVKKQSDAILLIEQKERFINKPLKVLLKEIKPAIKYAYGEDAKDHGMPAYFRFKFVTNEQTDSLLKKGLHPISIRVYVKENNIDWFGRTKRTKKTGTSWTSDDYINYSNFTVINIEIYGETTVDN
jgi:hypothetical protein